MTKSVPKGSIENNPADGLDNDLAPNKRETIVWTNADPIHWRIYAAPGGHKLIHIVVKLRSDDWRNQDNFVLIER